MSAARGQLPEPYMTDLVIRLVSLSALHIFLEDVPVSAQYSKRHSLGTREIC